MPLPLRGRLLAAALLLPLLAGACTSESSAAGDPTGRSTPVAGAAGLTSTAVPTPTLATTAPGSVGVDPSTQAPATTPANSAAIPSSTAPPIPALPALRVSTVPADGAANVSPTAPVTVKAQHGRLRSVAMTNPEGRAVKGSLSGDRTSWTSTEPLGYGRAYAVSSTAVDAAGRQPRPRSMQPGGSGTPRRRSPPCDRRRRSIRRSSRTRR